MNVVAIEMEDETYGIVMDVKEGGKIGAVPLCELEITSKKDKNY